MFNTPTHQRLVASPIGMNVAGGLCIAVGLATLLLATRQHVSATQASLGVLMIFIGFNAFYYVRMTRLESRVAQLEATIKEKRGSDS